LTIETSLTRASTLVTSVPEAQCIKPPTSVRKAMGSILVKDSEFFHSSPMPVNCRIQLALSFPVSKNRNCFVWAFKAPQSTLKNATRYWHFCLFQNNVLKQHETFSSSLCLCLATLNQNLFCYHWILLKTNLSQIPTFQNTWFPCVRVTKGVYGSYLQVADFSKNQIRLTKTRGEEKSFANFLIIILVSETAKKLKSGKTKKKHISCHIRVWLFLRMHVTRILWFSTKNLRIFVKENNRSVQFVRRSQYVL